jgi:hypothetical protein
MCFPANLVTYLLVFLLVDSNFLSMQRQMNNYGFLNLLSPRKENFATGRCVYAHSYFCFESNPEKLQEMIRYQGPKSPALNFAITSNYQKPSRFSSTHTNRQISKSPSSSTKVKKHQSSEKGKKPSTAAGRSVSNPRVNSSNTSGKRRNQIGQGTSQRTIKSRQRNSFPIPRQTGAASATASIHYSRQQLAKGASVKQRKPKQAATTGTPSKNLRTVPMACDSVIGEWNVQVGTPYPSPAGSFSSQPSVVTCKSFNALMRLPMPTPITCNKAASNEVDFESQTIPPPDHLFMLPSFLKTPSPSKRKRDETERAVPSNAAQRSPPAKSPCGDGFRVLFHAAQAVEFSPITIIHRAPSHPQQQVTTPSSVRVAAITHSTPQAIITTTASSEPSPIMSLVNMDFRSFRQAMDALQQPVDS